MKVKRPNIINPPIKWIFLEVVQLELDYTKLPSVVSKSGSMLIRDVPHLTGTEYTS